MKKLLELIKKLLGMSGSSDNQSSSESSEKGFTLIELLIVIAVIGVLAAVVLVAIDPIEQLKRGRDSGRKESVAQVGRAMQAYYTTHTTLPSAAQWSATPNILVSSGELKVFPAQPGGTTQASACPTGAGLNSFCFTWVGTSDFAVWSPLESKSDASRCTPVGTAGTNVWYVYLSALGKSGIYCGVENGVYSAATLY